MKILNIHGGVLEEILSFFHLSETGLLQKQFDFVRSFNGTVKKVGP